MNRNAIVVHSLELDGIRAGLDLIEKAQDQLVGETPVAGLLYAGIDHEHEKLVQTLYQKWPELQLIGCTTDGEFSSPQGYSEDAAVLTLLVGDHWAVSSGAVDNSQEDLREACRVSVEEALNRLGTKPALCILFSDVIRINGESVIHHLSEAFGKKVPVVGGMAADVWRFNGTVQFWNQTVSGDISPYLLIGEPLDLAWGIGSGWESFGESGEVTRAEGNVIYEINHKPALEFYQEILGEGAIPTLELPIAIHDSNGEYCFMRTSFEFFDRETGAIRFLGNVPEGVWARITMVNRDSILEGAARAMESAKAKFPVGRIPILALCFSCSARRVLLGTRTEEETDQVRASLYPGVPLSGFYTYGEICPAESGDSNGFHNETFVAVLMG